MGKRNILEKIPHKGFIKTGADKKSLDAKEKAILNRKGNEYFNSGDFELAKKIFITTGYSDGISRIGDHYLKKNNFVEALNMYYIAPAPDKKEQMIKKITSAIQELISKDIK